MGDELDETAEMSRLNEALQHSSAGQMLWGANSAIAIRDLSHLTRLETDAAEFYGKSVIILVEDQLTAAQALIELDGTARRLVLCPPDIQLSRIPNVAADADANVILVGPGTSQPDTMFDLPVIRFGLRPQKRRTSTRDVLDTEWALITSGTTGPAKMVVHSYAALCGAFANSSRAKGPVWATFYDIRRYGGLQIFLRAIAGGSSIVLSQAGESQFDYLTRLAEHRVTHISGTPSHWRQALQNTNLRSIDLKYIRLSGEIADQAIIDRLRGRFPSARISHAYASTEAGVVFEIEDLREGFPDSLLTPGDGNVEIEVAHGSLRVRSDRTAIRYLGCEAPPLKDIRGFIDTHDIVVRRDDRWIFKGRGDGVINIGGLKVHPEEVEAVINRHPSVRVSLVKGRRNPITGEIVVADVVLSAMTEGPSDRDHGTLQDEITSICRDSLSAYKVPAMIRFVADLNTSPSGKLLRERENACAR